MRAKKAPRSEIQARARAASIDRGRSKRTFVMLMLPAGQAAFKDNKTKKQALQRAKKERQNGPERLRMERMAAWHRPV